MSNIDNISDTTMTSLNSLKNSDVWQGAAAESFSEDFDKYMTELENERENINKLNTALAKLETYLKLGEEIESLKRGLRTPGENATPEEISSINSNNAYINSEIQIKQAERDKLRREIIAILNSIGVLGDISIIQIPNLENAKELYRYEGGAIYELKTANGLTYEAYIPDEYPANVPVVIYDAGDGDNGYGNSTANWNEFKERFKEGPVQAVIIRSKRQDSSAYYLDVIEQLNIVPTKPIAISHSGGTSKSSIGEFNDLMEQGQAKGGLFVVMDGYTPGPWWESQGYVENFKENDVVVITVAQGNDNGNYGYYNEGLAKMYPNTLVLYDKGEYGTSHGGVNRSLTENEVLEYFIGTGKLPDNYEIKAYDPETQQFVTVDYNDVNSVQKVYEYFGIEYK